jgi:hypothetical protein
MKPILPAIKKNTPFGKRIQIRLLGNNAKVMHVTRSVQLKHASKEIHNMIECIIFNIIKYINIRTIKYISSNQIHHQHPYAVSLNDDMEYHFLANPPSNMYIP